MIITNDKNLVEVKTDFVELFPHLKLEFYAHQHKAGEGSPKEEMLDPDLKIEAVRSVNTEGDLVVKPEMKVAELEQRFSDDYGLNVQVFRRSGNIWIQTSFTDEWTLEKQNRKGGSSEKHYDEMHQDD